MKSPTEKFSLNAYKWLQETPNRALNHAYKAAIAIQNIETEYFSGNKIGLDFAENPSVTNYFQIKLNKLLRTIRWRLAEFRVASVIVVDRQSEVIIPIANLHSDSQEILSKLTVIDKVLTRYSTPTSIPNLQDSPVSPNISNREAVAQESIFTKSSFIPRSLITTGKRLNREMRSNSEADVIREYQISKLRTRKSFQFLAILIIVPLLTQQVSKNLIFSPVLGYFHASKQIEISLNIQQEREVIDEIEFFEKKFKFEQIMNKAPQLSAEEYEKMVEEETIAIAKKYDRGSFNGLENVFSDLLSVLIFTWILIANPESIQILKSFMDELIYGLSDSAKALIIILFTDVFVGFHSSHGWEIAMESLLRHFGLPENREFIYLFIATFPVILDSTFKYWIFRYLSRISPSAVATYRNMNE